MLTATYTFAVISAEMKQARQALEACERDLRAILKNTPRTAHLNEIKAALNRLSGFQEGLGQRKIQTYIVPAVQAVSRETDRLLAEFAFLDNQAGNALQAAHDILREAFSPDTLKLQELTSVVDHYFRYVRRRLNKEEELLLPAAWRVLPHDTWFGIAKQYLAEKRDEDREEDPDDLPQLPQRIGASASPTLIQIPHGGRSAPAAGQHTA